MTLDWFNRMNKYQTQFAWSIANDENYFAARTFPITLWYTIIIALYFRVVSSIYIDHWVVKNLVLVRYFVVLNKCYRSRCQMTTGLNNKTACYIFGCKRVLRNWWEVLLYYYFILVRILRKLVVSVLLFKS